MGKLDKTKENIKLNKLGTADRKELFDKFVDSGGRIIDDKGELLTNKKRTVYDREKQLAYKRLIDAKKQKAAMNSGMNPAGTAGKYPEKGKPRPGLQGNFQNFMQRLNIRFRLFFLKVTDFSVTYFNNKFLNAYNTDYISSMMRVQSLFYELFKQDQDTGYEIKKELLEINNIYYDLIEKMSNLYDLKNLMQIVQAYVKSPEAAHRIIDVKDSTIQLFKKLYILKAYQENILNAFERSILIHMSITGGKSSYYSPKRKVMKADLFSIFEKLFPALYWLFCLSQRKIIKPGSPVIEEILGITATDKPGYRKKTSGTAAAEAQTEGAAKNNSGEGKPEDKKEDVNAPDAVSDDIKKGLQLLRHFDLKNIKKLRNVFDESKKFIKINDNDKIFMIYLIFQEFDREYAFLLTTNKVKYTVDYAKKVYIDFKEKLLMSSNDIKKCLSSFMDYTESTESYYNTKNEKPLSNDQYIEYNKKLGALLNKRTQSATLVRMTLTAFMDNISKLLKSLVDDMKGEKKIIENPGDVITFDVSVELNRKLNNKTIYQALSYACFFTCAFVFRMSSNGDLSGALEFNIPDDGEAIDNSLKSAEQKKSDAAEPGKEIESQQIEISESKDDGKSITDELDDLI